MKFSQVLAVAAASQLASAHTTVWNILVNGEDAGLGNTQGGYIDTPPNNNPVTDVTSSAMTCNVAGTKASKSITVKGGDKIAFQWHHDNNQASDDIIASSHKGPIMVYASKAGSSYSWTKIWEDGYSNGKWAVDKLIAGSYTGKAGQHDLTLPNLAPGDYVLRPEINALHEGNRQGGAQFYMECVHIKVEGSGTAVLPAGVTFPGAYKATDPGVLFDIYSGFTSYTPPGPKVWNGASSDSSPAASATTTTAKPATTTAAQPTTTAAKPTTTAAKPTTTAAAKPTTLATSVKPAATSAAGSVAKWAQCGGNGYTGATACVSGATCTKQNDYYSQCL
ncbi:carbohydrate-binding module family 1 protein [Didymella exigua CBS 183.55]|uniref:AA9 family lytic polysaccharide monooxygenase n=1 Tax=Didymella exigua CBS 183.55 TaxID=1150837 RepID=A0A6A5RKU5_9PLEO|nr:carbohydrate-binding module family 1 protein [Didymella exigua CBS 183.55]KAF1929035.1 carbohydrate-binding module family 1 protein [Didymella exigua CBS 183.55]